METPNCRQKKCKRKVMKRVQHDGNMWYANYCAKHYAIIRQRIDANEDEEEPQKEPL